MGKGNRSQRASRAILHAWSAERARSEAALLEAQERQTQALHDGDAARLQLETAAEAAEAAHVALQLAKTEAAAAEKLVVEADFEVIFFKIRALAEPLRAALSDAGRTVVTAVEGICGTTHWLDGLHRTDEIADIRLLIDELPRAEHDALQSYADARAGGDEYEDVGVPSGRLWAGVTEYSMRVTDRHAAAARRGAAFDARLDRALRLDRLLWDTPETDQRSLKDLRLRFSSAESEWKIVTMAVSEVREYFHPKDFIYRGETLLGEMAQIFRDGYTLRRITLENAAGLKVTHKLGGESGEEVLSRLMVLVP